MRIIILLAVFVASCASYKPIEKSLWPVKENELFKFTVSVIQEDLFNLYTGNGTVIHSCKKHGTYILTSHHIIDEPVPIRIGILDHCYKNKKEALIFYEEFYADQVFPKSCLLKDGSLESIFGGDYAILKLTIPSDRQSPVLFSAQIRKTEDLPSIMEPVNTCSIIPLKYPHVHKHIDRYSYNFDECNLPGHSGSGFFVNEQLCGVFSHVGKYQILNIFNPCVSKIQKELVKHNLDWIFTQRNCDEK